MVTACHLLLQNQLHYVPFKFLCQEIYHICVHSTSLCVRVGLCLYCTSVDIVCWYTICIVCVCWCSKLECVLNSLWLKPNIMKLSDL